jgi:hypothetical protein
MDSFQMLETVVAAADLPDDGILAGDIGTIVDVYTQLDLAYGVEFTWANGSPRAAVTVTPTQIRHLTPADILITRKLPGSR